MTGLVFRNRNNEEEDTTNTRNAGVDGDNDADIETFTNKPTDLETLAIEDNENNTSDGDVKMEASEAPLPLDEPKIDNDDKQDPIDAKDIKFEETTGVAGVPPEHRNDEIPAPELLVIDSDSEDDDDNPTRTRSGRISKPFDYAKEYPDVYGESETIVTESTSNYIEEIQPLDEEEYQLYKEALQLSLIHI